MTDVIKSIHEPLLETDPEFIERFDSFAFGEASVHGALENKTRLTAILAALLGCQGETEFRNMLPAAFEAGITPVEIKEVVYQATAYLGIARVLPFLQITNEFLTKRGVKLPLAGQTTTTAENRREAGTQAQVDIFGETMRDFWKSGPEETRHINRWLASNCFGDYYTRTGLDYRQREMITFCILAAFGGCEPQLTSHAAANLRLGNDRTFLIAVLSQCLPYIGYPRSLNALRCVDEAAKERERVAEAMEKKTRSVFPMGDKNEAYAPYFTGQSYLNMLSTEGVVIGNVTFEPGCRNNWHIHHKGGQILLCTGGEGWYQAWGKPAQRLRPGDVVHIPPEVKHWHGATKDGWFSHLAVEIPAEDAVNEWLEAVTDDAYHTLE